MKKYEYETVNEDDMSSTTFNDLGEDGFRLIKVTQPHEDANTVWPRLFIFEKEL